MNRTGVIMSEQLDAEAQAQQWLDAERGLPETLRSFDGERVVIALLDYLASLTQQQASLRELVNAQAEDDGLWFVAQTAPESYLQHELRRLHAAIEGESICR